MEFGKGEIPEKYTQYDRAAAVILPAPYEGTVTCGRGTARGPSKILESSYYLEFYDEELDRLTYRAGIATLPSLRPAAYPQAMIKSVVKVCKKIVSDFKFPVLIGGEHSLSLGLYIALKHRYKDLSVLQIDAHADMRSTYEGSKYNHACVMRRIGDTCKNTVQIGIRALCFEERNYIRATKRQVYFAKDVRNKSAWINRMLKQLTKNVYVTIDVDGFDPSVVPHTGTPEPGGLSWFKVMEILKRVFHSKNVVGFDVMELAPTSESAASDLLAAKLVYKLIGYKFLKKLKPL
jgi:agmatinase